MLAITPQTQGRLTPLTAPESNGCSREDLVPGGRPTSSGRAEGRRFDLTTHAASRCLVHVWSVVTGY